MYTRVFKFFLYTIKTSSIEYCFSFNIFYTLPVVRHVE